MKKKDLVLIGILLVILIGGYFIFEMMQGSKDIVEVYYKNEKIQEIDLSINETYDFKGSYGEFHLEVKDNEYHAINVECPNHDCEKVGWVKQGSSKTIVCVPNEIYIIQSGVEDQIQ